MYRKVKEYIDNMSDIELLESVLIVAIVLLAVKFMFTVSPTISIIVILLSGFIVYIKYFDKDEE
jgi:uncharacterized protein YqgC (DUF456 family)